MDDIDGDEDGLDHAYFSTGWVNWLVGFDHMGLKVVIYPSMIFLRGFEN